MRKFRSSGFPRRHPRLPGRPESFLPAILLVTKQSLTPSEGLNVGTQAHTSPERSNMSCAIGRPRQRLRDRRRKTDSLPIRRDSQISNTCTYLPTRRRSSA